MEVLLLALPLLLLPPFLVIRLFLLQGPEMLLVRFELLRMRRMLLLLNMLHMFMFVGFITDKILLRLRRPNRRRVRPHWLLVSWEYKFA